MALRKLDLFPSSGLPGLGRCLSLLTRRLKQIKFPKTLRFLFILEFRTVGKVQKPGDSEEGEKFDGQSTLGRAEE
jgi:hypothetical protein